MDLAHARTSCRRRLSVPGMACRAGIGCRAGHGGRRDSMGAGCDGRAKCSRVRSCGRAVVARLGGIDQATARARCFRGRRSAAHARRPSAARLAYGSARRSVDQHADGPRHCTEAAGTQPLCGRGRTCRLRGGANEKGLSPRPRTGFTRRRSRFGAVESGSCARRAASRAPCPRIRCQPRGA